MVAYVRYAQSGREPLLVVVNLTPVPCQAYRIGVPREGHWREVFNTDAHEFSGSGWGNLGGLSSKPIASHGRTHSLELTLPPLSVLVFKHDTPSSKEIIMNNAIKGATK